MDGLGCLSAAESRFSDPDGIFSVIYVAEA
jgi:hypothetical protein